MSHHPTWIRGALAAAVLAVVIAPGCARPRGPALRDAVRTYNDGVRWERFTAAAAVVPSRERDQFLDERETLARDLRITDYEVVRVDERGDHARIRVKLTWYLDSEGTVRETWVAQAWERRGHGWMVTDEQRVRGADMPGVTAAPDADQNQDEAAAARPAPPGP